MAILVYVSISIIHFTFTTLVVTIGFSSTAYTVIEDAASVSVTVSIQSGALNRDVIVTLSTINGTAMSKFQPGTQQHLVCYFSQLSSLQLEKSTLLCLPTSLSMPVHQLKQ